MQTAIIPVLLEYAQLCLKKRKINTLPQGMQILNIPNPMFHQQSYKMKRCTVKFRSRTKDNQLPELQSLSMSKTLCNCSSQN